ncbi:MAG: amino acid permease [Planctomycetes bacterium]|nr:amino acid permease [Planctomycetota bacterium]
MPLKRELGFLHVFAMAAGAMISSGLFVLPAVAFAMVGAGLPYCYLLAAVMLLPAVLTKAELITAMPKAGGTYFFIDRSLGPGFGTVGGVVAWASLAFKSAFALVGIGALGALAWHWNISSWQVKAIACAFCLFFAALNMLGAKHAGRAQILLVAVLLVILTAYGAAGVRAVQPTHMRPLLPHGWSSLLMVVGMVFISFGGVTKVATMGEEVHELKRDLLGGMFAACIVVGLLYALVVYVTVGVLPEEPAEWWPIPLAQAAGVMFSTKGVWVLAMAGLFAFLTTGNAGVLAASRILMAMSQDQLVPAGLGRIHPRRGTPTRAILFTAAFMVSIILLLELETFIKAASTMMLLLFIFEMISLVLMRESHIPTYRPTWKCPFYPWLQIGGSVCYTFLLVELGTFPLAVAGLIICAAVLWYVFYAKVHVLRESALIRLAGRIARWDFADHDLEAELSRMARERKEELTDRFDSLIQDCPVLDLEGGVTREEAFEVIAQALSDQIGYPSAGVLKLLTDRETLSSTVVRPGLAIPHLIFEGLESFQIMLVRSKEGVIFSEDAPPVHIVFVIAANPEERNFYLRALVAIAEIAQDPGFDDRWLATGGPEALREVVLSAERRRDK